MPVRLQLARVELRCSGMPKELIRSGCVDLEAYAMDLLERRGCVMTDDEGGFVSRNSEIFTHERTRAFEIQMQ